MIPVVTNKTQLLNEIEKQFFFEAIKEQLNKDFNFSGINYNFTSNNIKSLYNELINQLLNLISSNFTVYLNLLYRIDVSESKIKNIPEVEIPAIVEKAAFLILKREFQKVWFRNKL
jgi:hypothetical protein